MEKFPNFLAFIMRQQKFKRIFLSKIKRKNFFVWQKKSLLKEFLCKNFMKKYKMTKNSRRRNYIFNVIYDIKV